ncbi:Uncharacterised protein [Mycobacteroides abscessus]|nr:Uncharacterised protein [Mycobacteroides abscessus]
MRSTTSPATSRDRSATSTSSSDGVRRREGRGDPRGRVLDRDAARDVDAQALRGEEVGLRVGLAALDLVAADQHLERVRRRHLGDGLGELAVGHRDERARHASLAQRREELARAGLPRHLDAHLLDHAPDEERDDLVHR